MCPQFPTAFCVLPIPFWNELGVSYSISEYPSTPANIITNAPPPSLKFWESWAQHTQISRKLLIYNDFPMPKIKKAILGIACHFGQSIDFKQVFSEILGIVTACIYKHKLRLYSTLAYISFNSHHLQIKILAKS